MTTEAQKQGEAAARGRESSELNELLADIEWYLSDDSEIAEAVNKGCISMNNTSAPMVALLMAREKVQKIKALLGS